MTLRSASSIVHKLLQLARNVCLQISPGVSARSADDDDDDDDAGADARGGILLRGPGFLCIE